MQGKANSDLSVSFVRIRRGRCPHRPGGECYVFAMGFGKFAKAYRRADVGIGPYIQLFDKSEFEEIIQAMMALIRVWYSLSGRFLTTYRCRPVSLGAKVFFPVNGSTAAVPGTVR